MKEQDKDDNGGGGSSEGNLRPPSKYAPQWTNASNAARLDVASSSWNCTLSVCVVCKGLGIQEPGEEAVDADEDADEDEANEAMDEILLSFL
jgi:hypothetical protein